MQPTDRSTMIKEIMDNSELFTLKELNIYSDIALRETHRALFFIIKITKNVTPNDTVGK